MCTNLKCRGMFENDRLVLQIQILAILGCFITDSSEDIGHYAHTWGAEADEDDEAADSD